MGHGDSVMNPQDLVRYFEEEQFPGPGGELPKFALEAHCDSLRLELAKTARFRKLLELRENANAKQAKRDAELAALAAARRRAEVREAMRLEPVVPAKAPSPAESPAKAVEPQTAMTPVRTPAKAQTHVRCNQTGTDRHATRIASSAFTDCSP